MEDEAVKLDRHIAGRVRELRIKHGLSLDALARNSGVSRSMISLIERGESSPTAAVLHRLAIALSTTLASLFDPPKTAAKLTGGPLARRVDQPEWCDPGSGYVRRNVSPPAVRQPMQIIEVHFPPGKRVAFESHGRDQRVYQQVWVLEGAINITLGAEHHRLEQGDCLAMQLDQPIVFHNPARKAARYAVVIVSEPRLKR